MKNSSLLLLFSAPFCQEDNAASAFPSTLIPSVKMCEPGMMIIWVWGSQIPHSSLYFSAAQDLLRFTVKYGFIQLSSSSDTHIQRKKAGKSRSGTQRDRSIRIYYFMCGPSLHRIQLLLHLKPDAVPRHWQHIIQLGLLR